MRTSTPKTVARPEVLKIRVEVCRARKQWEMMAEVSNHLRKIEPDEVSHSLDHPGLGAMW